MRITSLVGAMCLAAAVTGCTSQAAQEEPTSNMTNDGDFTEVGAEVNPDGHTQGEELYLSLLRSNYPSDFLGVSDSTLLGLGQNICDALDQGFSAEDVFLVGAQAGYEAKPVGGLVGASVAAFCPEFSDIFQ